MVEDVQKIESTELKIDKDINFSELAPGDERYSQKLFNMLLEHDIPFTLLKHKPVYTCAEAEFIGQHLVGADVKNFFLQDKKKKFSCVLTALQDTTFKLNDLKGMFAEQYPDLNVPKLQFGKEEILNDRLKLITGSVNPFGVLNDESKETILFLDAKLMDCEYAQFHPLVNSMSISVPVKKCMDMLKSLGYQVLVVKLD